MKNLFSRRAFLGAAATLAAGSALAPAVAGAKGLGFGSTRRVGDLAEAQRTEFLMGTFVTATACDPSADRAQEALGAAFAEIRRLCAVLDRRVDGTDAARLNQAGSLSRVHPELALVAAKAVDMHRLTNGAFDPTVLPVLELLEHSVGADGRVHLDRAEEARALRLVDGSLVRVSGRDVRLERSGMRLTLDGVGKGYVVDKACEAMAARGVSSCMVNAGGDIRCMGPRLWTLAVQNPAGGSDYPSVIGLRDAALATSGGYERPIGASGKYNHVVSPSSGLSPTQVSSVSVAAATAMQADALATAAFVMPVRSGLALADSLAECECLILGADGARLASRGWGVLERARRTA
ncbi:FAD:protein FMN transferase [Desulfocurvus sp. DL9XJH121]